MDYLNFDLRLADWSPLSRTGTAEVLRSPNGEGERHSFSLELDLETAAARIHRTQGMAVELGRSLAHGVFSTETQTLWHESYHIARGRNRGLRLRLRIDSWELSRLPWELLYDDHRGEFLVFDPYVSLVRYLSLHAAQPVPRQGQQLKVLAILSAPQDLVHLECERELAVLQESLRELTASGQVQIIPCEHATQEKLYDALFVHRPDVVHFMGHGEYDQGRRLGILYLEDERGNNAPLEAPDAARMLRRCEVSLVVLNACESAMGAWAGLAPALVRAEIPAVVAMQWPVEDRAAIRFSRLFYKALALGRTIDECVAEGRMGASVRSPDPHDWAAPVLFLRSTTGKLWSAEPGKAHEAKSEAAREQPAFRGAVAATSGTAGPTEGFHFKTRGPLLTGSDADLIIDRPELRRAVRLAQQPSVTQYIAFLSARQTGKTTLLFRLMELLGRNYTSVFIDLSVLRAQDARACFRFVAFRLVSEFRNLLGDSAFLSEHPQIESSVEFLEFLRQLAAIVTMPRIILLLDEVGALSPQASDGFFNTLRTVFTEGRGLNSGLSKYLFVFSGAVDLYTLTFGTNSPLNICEKLYLRDLELSDVQHIVGHFSQLGVTVPPEAPAQIYQLAGGHPYLTMRLCALLERTGVQELTPDKIDLVAQQMLMEDDNIQHVIRELERRPLERKRLHSILIEGRQMPFSRNDPFLASLEMIGAIKATQPCEVRNQLYERALRQYYAQSDSAAVPLQTVATPEAASSDAETSSAMYSRLESLHHEAVDAEGRYLDGKPWEILAAALFSMVPAFSVYPNMYTDTQELDLVLAINANAPGGSHWSTYQPAILVERHNLDASPSPDALDALFAKASQHNIKLVFVLTTGAFLAQPPLTSGTRGEICLVFLRDAEITRLLERREDLDAFLRAQVFEARLRRI